MSITDWLCLFMGANLGLCWVLSRKIDRLRETLRRNAIYHDKEKPWEGA